MPIPKPSASETRPQFMERCMSNETMLSEYPQDQRAGICNTSWDDYTKGSTMKQFDELNELLSKAEAEMNQRFTDFKQTVNMSASEIKRWGNNDCAGLASRTDDGGDGPSVVRNRVIKLLETPKSEWGQDEFTMAGRVVSFVSRMKGNEQGEPVKDGCPSKRDISLMNWGYNPNRKAMSVGNMVHYEFEDGEGIGKIEATDEEGGFYSIRQYAQAEDEFVPTDTVLNIPIDGEVHDYDQYLLGIITTEELDNEPEMEQVEPTTEQVEEEVDDEEGDTKSGKIMAKFKQIDFTEDENVGIIEGFASTYGNVDLGGDVVERGAFTQTIKHKNGIIPLLLDHNYTTGALAGVGFLEDSDEGLKIRAEMPLDVPEVASAYRKIKFMLDRGAKIGLSIGYNTIKAMKGDNGTMRLKELALHEVSITPFPMNTEAQIMSAKAQKLRKQAEKIVPQAHTDAPEGNQVDEGAKALLDELTQTLKTIENRYGHQNH
jgi:HK97 family phage prohead protease